MRAGRLPENDPREQEARARLRQPSQAAQAAEQRAEHPKPIPLRAAPDREHRPARRWT